MPIYEYEPDDRVCYICDGRVEVLQAADDPPLEVCPTCGLEVRRLVSGAQFKISKVVSPEEAATHGFATWRKSGKGVWEKIGGEGPDVIERKEDAG
ncbi:MAG: zinc ribbon domain-containing protein [Fimbriimonas ginsengisoli]|uniref:Zinc ribbon domain-containing protein n=1 Tax=Fimbriimonas ginsengisoli TaxID=1005039 RepID=A0A931LUC4_FIMGI|nr:zinc ribbon domain-containing protein [Fimbriimonas ginsengisoli]